MRREFGGEGGGGWAWWFLGLFLPLSFTSVPLALVALLVHLAAMGASRLLLAQRRVGGAPGTEGSSSDGAAPVRPWIAKANNRGRGVMRGPRSI